VSEFIIVGVPISLCKTPCLPGLYFVLFRLISSTGSPHVKLGASEDGGGLVLGGDGGCVQILSRGTNTPFVRIAAKDGRERMIKPQ
jgi:hypothetical protein